MRRCANAVGAKAKRLERNVRRIAAQQRDAYSPLIYLRIVVFPLVQSQTTVIIKGSYDLVLVAEKRPKKLHLQHDFLWSYGAAV